MTRRVAAEQSRSVYQCEKCNTNPLVRTVHLLQMIDGEGFDTAKHHLTEQFSGDHQGAFRASELQWCLTIQRFYSEALDNWGRPVPAWRTWLERHHAVSRRDGKLVIGKKQHE